MEAIQAEEMLREHGGNLTAKGIYNLVLQATGDAIAAQDAMSDKIMAQLRRDEKVEL